MPHRGVNRRMPHRGVNRLMPHPVYYIIDIKLLRYHFARYNNNNNNNNNNRSLRI